MSEAEKLLSLFEARFQAFGVRLADYDSVMREIADLKKFFESLMKKVLEQETDYSAFKSKSMSSVADSAKLSDFLKNLIEVKFSKVEQMFSVLEKRISSIEELRNEYYVMSGNQTVYEEKITNLFGLKDAANKKINALEALIASHGQLIESSVQDLCALKEKFPGIWEPIRSLQNALDKTSNKVEDLKEAYKNLQELLNVHSSNRRTELLSEIKTLAAQFDQKLSSIVIPEVKDFVKGKELEAIQHELNLANLEAKNASAKSNNNEMQLQLISKKVDGALIQLKALDYAGK